MKTRQPKRRRISGRLQEKIETLALKGWSPIQIYNQLSEDESINPDDLPTQRTVQRIWNDINPKPSRPWSMGETDSEATPVILAVLAEVVRTTAGRIQSLTVAQSEWVTALSQAAPDLPPWGLYVLATTYLKRRETDTSTVDLDQYLAFAPWRDNFKNEGAYKQAVEKGYVQQVPESVYRAVEHGIIAHRMGRDIIGSQRKGGISYGISMKPSEKEDTDNG